MTTVKLNRTGQNQQWGFRIHGGRDFNQPLIVLKVTGGSIAASSGLTPGDTLLKINGTDTGTLNHKDAQDLIKNAGNCVEFVVIKAGQQTWKPNVQVIDGNNGESDGQVLVNKQFNTPINIYSEQSIAETLSAQAEVLAGGAIGVNFKKNEKKYNYENSEVYKMLQEVENEQPSYNDGEINSHRIVQSEPKIRPMPQPRPQQQIPQPSAAPPPQIIPIQQQQQPQQQSPVTTPTTLPPGSNICADCERLIVGVFVRIKDKNLHVDCFKCSTCGQSLKNIGYYNINNKLYCDIHAKTVARAQTDFSPKLPSQPAGLPITGSQPLTKPFSYTQQPIDSYAAKIAPLPFHHSPSGTSHVPAPKSPQLIQPSFTNQNFNQSSTFESFQQKTTSFESSSSSSGSKVIWPPAGGLLGQPQAAPLQQPPQPPQQQSPQINNFSPVKTAPMQSAQPKFKQQHVPYQPLSTLLAPAGKPSFAPVQAPGVTPGHVSAPAFQPAQAPAFQPAQAPAFQPTFAPPTFQPITQNFAAAPTFAPAPAPTFAPAPAQNFAPAPAPSQNFAPAPNFKPTAPAFKPGPGGFGGPSGPSAPSGGPGGASKSTSSNILANRIGRGILNQPGGHSRIATCGACLKQIRGPFVSAGSKFYCPDHFKCGNETCKRDLMEIGFVEEKNNLYCEFCWEQHIAPVCGKCQKRIKNECLKAIGQDFHPNCFACKHCGKLFGKESFFLEDGFPYCQADWNEMFTTKCHGCGFPIEAGDRWVEALKQNWHSQCFNCSACKKNLEGASFFAKAGRPFCKSHAR